MTYVPGKFVSLVDSAGPKPGMVSGLSRNSLCLVHFHACLG
jgi:hypothetical protein